MTKSTTTTDTADGGAGSTDGFIRRLAVLEGAAAQRWLMLGGRGIEKESLRVTATGALAMSPHPAALGAALTHPEITTDYSESLLEFITPPVPDPAVALASLHDLHAFTHRRLGTDLLWDASMPGRLPPDDEIPIAEYGRSNLGRFKHVYRRGLALRYGRTMQCIAGIHYNFSLHESIWPLLQAPLPQECAHDDAPPNDIQSAAYMVLMRNYRRFSWLLLYLFGASPALDRSFFGLEQQKKIANAVHTATTKKAAGDPAASLDALDSETCYLPFATSLRMSDLGYQNRSNNGAKRPDLVSLPAYLHDVAEAIAAPYAAYDAIGTHINGEWAQLNTHLLQIENELYATIRPKRVGAPGERVVHALARHGIQYVEVRCLDIDPFEHVGISEETVRFLDTFLLMCVLEDSPTAAALQSEADRNFFDVARDGRRPGKVLQSHGTPIALTSWAEQLFQRMDAAARVLDQARSGYAHRDALQAQRAKLANPATLPSARVLDAVRAAGSFAAFGLQQSRAHAAYFVSVPLPKDAVTRFERLRDESFKRQQAIEASDTVSFEQFVAEYGCEPAAPDSGHDAGTAGGTKADPREDGVAPPPDASASASAQTSTRQPFKEPLLGA